VLTARQPTCAHPGCNARTLLQTDHIKPYNKGGPTTLANLQLLCGPHNRAKGG
jgi:5-methylcytosine-specific restriction endonuclease McrA